MRAVVAGGGRRSDEEIRSTGQGGRRRWHRKGVGVTAPEPVDAGPNKKK